MKNTHSINILLYTALAVSLFTEVLFFYSHQRQAENTNEIIHTHEIIVEFTKLFSALQDVETGQRGYILTQKEEYLEPFEQGLKDIKKCESVLNSAITKKYPEKQEILKEYLTKKIKELQQTVDLTKNNKKNEALSIIESGKGKEYMDKIRTIFKQIEAQELGEQHIKEDWLREILYFFGIINSIFILFILVVLIISLVSFKKYDQQNKNLLNELNIQNQNLELKVKERTAELEKSNNDLLLADEELKQQNEEIMQNNEKLALNQQKLEHLSHAKDEILGVVAHDLRNPINAIIGLSSLIKMNMESELTQKKQTEIDEYLKLITQSCQKGNEIIKELLEVSELESVDFVLYKQEENVVLLMENAIQAQNTLLENKKIKIEKNFQENEIFVKINKEKFGRVLDNLLSNAIKFSFENSTIFLNIQQKHQKILFSVQDEGMGISDEMQKILFDKFSKARRKGTKGEKSVGLGMSIIQNIVQLHGGNIWVNSQENKGSTFFVEIPIT